MSYDHGFFFSLKTRYERDYGYLLIIFRSCDLNAAGLTLICLTFWYKDLRLRQG